MFIPRSLAKRAPKASESSARSTFHSSTSTPASTDSQPGPSNPKKRNIETDGQSTNKSSNETDSSSGEDSDEITSSGSESGSGSDSGSDSDSDGDDKKQPTPTLTKPSKPNTDSTAVTRQAQTQSEIAARLELALSDVSLWRNESLFQRLSETQDWYLPLSRLYDHPLLEPRLGVSGSRVPDASLVTALRTYGSDAFESQIKMRAPSNAAWKGKAASGWVGAGGGYEVRCRAWEGREEGWMDRLANMEEREWEARMAYVEHVPATVRSVWALYHYLTALARLYQPDEQSQLVQDVFVPTAESTITERPVETTQRFRGQAFVVFSTVEIAQAFCERWIWNPVETSRDAARSSGSASGKWDTEDAVAAATSTGFRSITKARWDQLKSEYLAHQARVLKQNLKSGRRPPVHNGPQSAPSIPPTQSQTPIPSPTALPKPPRAARPPPFPPGILVFVRRLHPETNKTTLKTLFGRAFPDGKNDAIEYLDFQKGIDSAHIRFRTPPDASTFVECFTSHFLTQRDALDSEGEPCEKEVAIEAEIVSGIREMNYWEKVPEKVRMAAVGRAGLGGGGDDAGGGGGDRGRRKRQRRG
ncbi:hypothetical protein FRC12_019279 [Ceratobasidium sp. 428]|nr:hypothetical protein FRC12_019279 [Ceratobasidium sp. 428]